MLARLREGTLDFGVAVEEEEQKKRLKEVSRRINNPTPTLGPTGARGARCGAYQDCHSDLGRYGSDIAKQIPFIESQTTEIQPSSMEIHGDP